MTPFVLAVDSALMHFVWQGVVVSILLWITLAALRGRSANARYLASCVALGLLAGLPVGTALLSYTRPAPLANELVIIIARTGGASPLASPVDWIALAQSWMLPVWACGVLLLAVRMLWGCAQVSRLKRQGEPAEPAVVEMVERLAARIGVTRPVRTLISKLSDGPSVAGWIRPALLLPTATVLGLSVEQLEAVIAHELAHVRRYDYLINLIQMLVETVLFYHPAVWWVSRRIRTERELCCDDIAVCTCGDAVCYARALVTLEKLRIAVEHAAFSPALGAKGGPLMYRIERLLGTAQKEPAPSRLPGIVAIVLGLACFVPTIKPVKAQTPPPAPVAAPTPRGMAQMQTAPPGIPSQSAAVVFRITPTVVDQSAVFFQVAQSKQPSAQSSEPSRPVIVEVTVDTDGTVQDARVIDGPLSQRRSALLAALAMRFDRSSASSTHEVKVLDDDPDFGLSNLAVRSIGTKSEARDRIANSSARISQLTALLAQSSERGAAQLQEAINRERQAVGNLQSAASGPDPLIGTELAAIRIDGPGATVEERQRVLAKLPIRLHDTLSDDSMQAAVRAVHENYAGASAYFGEVAGSAKGAFIVVLPFRPSSPVR